MTQTLGSQARIDWEEHDRLNPKATDRDILKILELVVEFRHLWEQAVDGGVYSARDGYGRPSGHGDPTEAAAMRPTQKQLRGSAKYAASCVADARIRLEDAARVLHNGLLRTDPEVLEGFLEKRRAALQEGS